MLRPLYFVPSRILKPKQRYMTQSSTEETRVCSQGQFSRAMLLLNTTMNSYTITPSKNAHAPYFWRTDA